MAVLGYLEEVLPSEAEQVVNYVDEEVEDEDELRCRFPKGSALLPLNPLPHLAARFLSVLSGIPCLSFFSDQSRGRFRSSL